MIKRYTRPEMGAIWTEKNRYRKWLDVELAVCEAWQELGEIPADAFQRIKQKFAGRWGMLSRILRWIL